MNGQRPKCPACGKEILHLSELELDVFEKIRASVIDPKVSMNWGICPDRCAKAESVVRFPFKSFIVIKENERLQIAIASS